MGGPSEPSAHTRERHSKALADLPADDGSDAANAARGLVAAAPDDLEITAAVSSAVGIPVVASGGAGSVEDFAPAVLEGGASAVLAASIFHFGEHTIAEAKAAMQAAGVTVRPVG